MSPSKTTKKARRAGGRKVSNAPVEKDDGTRWIVWNLDTDHPAYLTKGGTTKAEAKRLAEGLVAPTELRQVIIDG